MSRDSSRQIELTLPTRPRPIGAVEAAIAAALENVPRGQRPGFRRYLGMFPQPSQYPLFDQLVVDASGRLWVREYVAPGDSAARWVVITDQNESLAEAMMPADFLPAHIGSDWVLAGWKGEYDEEYVALFTFDSPW